MSSSKNDRAPLKVWSLEQAALWIETRASVPRHPIDRQIAPTTVQELHQVLKVGTIRASGCVDGGERRAISPEEWNDYRLRLKHTAFTGYYTGSFGTPVIAVLSIRSFPAAVLKYHGYRSRLRVPSAQSRDGEPAYHRVITDVLLQRQEVMREWVSDPIAGSEIGTILANGLIKRCHTRHDQSDNSLWNATAENSLGTYRFQTSVRAEQTRSVDGARHRQSKANDRQCSSCRARTGFRGRRRAAHRALNG